MPKVSSVAAVVGLVGGLAVLLWLASEREEVASTRTVEPRQPPEPRVAMRPATPKAGEKRPPAEEEGNAERRSRALRTGTSALELVAPERGDQHGDRPHSPSEAIEAKAHAGPSGEAREAPVADHSTEEYPTTDCTDTWCWSGAAGVEVMRAEVTAGQFGQCVADGHCRAAGLGKTAGCTFWRPERRDLPMNCLNYDEAANYCQWQNARLPLLEEWYAEYRARGKYPWGDEEPSPSRVAQGPGLGKPSGRESGLPDPPCSHPEGRSESGLCDMVGNLAEWTGDPEPGAAPPTTPLIVVGFAYDSLLHDVQVGRGSADEYTGFRCVRDRATPGRDAGN